MRFTVLIRALQRAVLILAVTALGLSAWLYMRPRKVKPTAPEAPKECDLSARPPSPVFPKEPATLLLSAEPPATIRVDGRSVTLPQLKPLALTVGAHQIEAACGTKPDARKVDLPAYAPGAVFVRCRAKNVEWFTAGVQCDGCRLISEPKKKSPRKTAAAREGDLLSAYREAEKQAHSRAKLAFTKLWNQLTERYSRALAVVGNDAQSAVAAANLRFEELSQGFSLALQNHDVNEQAATVRAGAETLATFVHSARLAKPRDCEFQKRLTDAF
jgi:hypothetical protein